MWRSMLRNLAFVSAVKSSQMEEQMQAAIDRVMQAFTMMANLTPAEAEAARGKLTAHLAAMEADEKTLAVEGLRYLRGPDRVSKRRIARKV
jgi:hypothetical protein